MPSIDRLRGDMLGRAVVRATTIVTKRRVLAYAASIGAVDDVYYDDLQPGGLIATPGFICAIESPLLFDPVYLHAIGMVPERLLSVWIHAFQDSVFHQPMRAGQTLESVLSIVHMAQLPSGALVTCHIATNDAVTGQPVAESWYGSLYRGLSVAAPGGQAAPRLRAHAGVDAGAIEHTPIAVTPGTGHLYTECSGIWSPIHTERAAAVAAGLDQIILHGTWTWSAACLAITRSHADGDPSRIKRFGGRFSGMVGSDPGLVLEHARTDDGSIAFAVQQRSGQLAISHGVALVAPA
ncbi:MaoC/PaaZ C-terminal domain-containing protein [Herbaspirillum sp. alder98]|uniref:MaoC/PaaZ C-terminal domain-containing protein n=1 Tax=Herbaspirillum sp. alder98 TaxID=2913096 RepID=UPI001CD83259|nr:MaoC/PaaZ C-terminal domain-containing protein [Herbaspirillum sp. alder98]MCA1326073.1 MaoC family dehydratase N-terminal domain-containing protein [Herbaspirillum sp. alder98]